MRASWVSSGSRQSTRIWDAWGRGWSSAADSSDWWARNGREWHRLIELCGMAGAVIVDPDGIYDPTLMNDRLLLGLKGTMREFELNLLRQGSAEAIRQKAQRGELQFRLPVGYLWAAAGKIEKDPDPRIQEALSLAFSMMTELGSVRQALLWFRREAIPLPRRNRTRRAAARSGDRLPTARCQACCPTPCMAEPMSSEKPKARTRLIEGRTRKTLGHQKPRGARGEWTVLIPYHHPGYISWERYEHRQAMLAANAHMKSQMEPQAGRGGRALPSGVLRCRPCGRMLYVSYSGSLGTVPRHRCQGPHQQSGDLLCIRFSGPARGSCGSGRSLARHWRQRGRGKRRKKCGGIPRSNAGQWRWSKRAMRPSCRRGAMRQSIPAIVWWWPSWKPGGT